MRMKHVTALSVFATLIATSAACGDDNGDKKDAKASSATQTTTATATRTAAETATGTATETATNPGTATDVSAEPTDDTKLLTLAEGWRLVAIVDLQSPYSVLYFDASGRLPQMPEFGSAGCDLKTGGGTLDQKAGDSERVVFFNPETEYNGSEHAVRIGLAGVESNFISVICEVPEKLAADVTYADLKRLSHDTFKLKKASADH